MDIVDLLTMMIVVAILVSVALGAATYLARKLRRARQSAPEEGSGDDRHWYFVRYTPDTRPDEDM